MRGWLSVVTGALVVCAQPVLAQTYSTYGTPGLIDMPTAEVMEDGELALTTSVFGATNRNTLFFQFLPRVYGTFRYSILEDFNAPGTDRFDRSFDLHFQLFEERPGRPGVAVGLRDLIGTGVYSSEYLVATKTVAPGVKITGGLGWGRLGQRGGFDNILGIIDDGFETRPGRSNRGGGRLEADAWFRGDMAFFGGVSWEATERLTFKAEYSTDTYSEEEQRGVQSIDGGLNLGVNYSFKNGIDLSAFSIGSDEVGVQFSYHFNPKRPRVPAGLDKSAPALVARETLASASWNLPAGAAAPQGGVTEVLRRRLAQEGITLQGLRIDGDTALMRVQNELWSTEAQAAGRATRSAANTLPPDVETFKLVFQQNGMAITTITTQRSDFEELEFDLDGSWRSLTRAQISDAAQMGRTAELPGAFPEFEFELTSFTRFSFFDPEGPVSYEIGPQVFAAYRPAPGLTLSTALRYPVAGNIEDANRAPNSALPRVRTDALQYAKQSDFEVSHMTAEYLFRPGEDLFGRITAGYLETMYAGVSGELLWAPINSRLALGAELNYVRQRDFDVLFGMQDYDVLTGHASAYYDFGNGFHGQVDAGRYLAGDWGATFKLTREFNNGFKVGGFFTLTDVPFSEFGEGSFDKGILFEIPTSWLTGKPSRNKVSQVIRPVQRDGGARLDVRNRLYDLTRDYRADQLGDGWGRYFR